MKKHLKPFGLWPSPISATMLGAQLRLGDVQFDSDGETLVWLESRSGKGTLVARRGSDAPRDLTEELSVRAGVGYGGGEFAVGHRTVVFSSSGRLHRISLDSGRPVAITPAFGEAASPAISPDGTRVLYVHSYENSDCLAIADLEGGAWPVRLARGADFYMQPAWHPDGTHIAWIEWDHPRMPWDGTRLQIASLAGSSLGEVATIDGGEDIPIFQPAFSPDGRSLSYIRQAGNQDQLCLVDLASGQTRVLVEALVLLPPAWVQGMRVQAWSPDSARIIFLHNDRGYGQLKSVDTASSAVSSLETGPYSWFSQPAASPVDERLAFIGSAAHIPDRVVTWDSGTIQVERRSASESIPAEDMSQPQVVSWAAPDGTTVYGLYYPPASSRYRGEGPPPAVISIHGGPTSQRMANFNPDALFFTSRGYAYMEVNFRGSTGYGRDYMLALRQNWGRVDVEDAAGAARALGEQGLADPGRLVIKGGSSGGYTVLNTLIRHPGLFKAGICLYGVADLFLLSMETHKFEERYNDSLVGTLPEATDRFREWSPIFHADKIQDPVAFFQGAEDRVVPPAQTEAMVQAVRANRVPHIYKLYEGEGHGWKKSETIADFYTTVEKFLQKFVIYA